MITAIVLAAGTSIRMKRLKQLLPYQGRPLVRHVVENLLQTAVDQIIVVVGYEAETVAGTLSDLPVNVVVNQNYLAGMSSSLKAGMNFLVSGQVCAQTRSVLFVLGDQPLVKPETVNLLISNYNEHRGITVPVYNGVRGNPVIFDARYFKEFETLSGDEGARQVIESHTEDVSRVEVSDQGVVVDVDTWNDYCDLT